MSRNKGINKLVVSNDTTPSLQELPVLASETLGVFVHSTNSTVPSKLFLSQGTTTQASFSRIEFDTDSGLGIFTDVPFVSSHDASIKFNARGTDYWKIEGVNGSSGDLLPLINNQLKIGRSGFNLAETFSRKITSDSTLALAAGGATKWNLDSGGNLIPSTANSQNFGATTNPLSQIFGNQLNSGTGQALYLGSNGGAYQWRIANGTNAALIPNSTYDIGASGSRVGKLWGTDIDITGTINSGGFSSSGDVITNSIRTIGTSDNLVIKTGTGFTERLRIGSDGNVTVSKQGAEFYVGDSNTSTQSCLIQIGNGRTGSGQSYIDFIGDTTYSDFGLRITREAGGANANSILAHRGTGSLVLQTQDAAPIVMVTGLSERMRITSTGKVGIGTTSPYANLDVASSLQIGGSATSSNNFHITAESIGALQFWNGNYGTGTELMRITSGGNVGIGTTTPTYKLDVRGTIRIGNASSSVFGIDFGTTGVGTYRSAYIFGDGSNVIFSNQQDGYFALHTNNTERMRITSNGNVGIGISNPVASLHIDTSSNLLSVGEASLVVSGSGNKERIAARHYGNGDPGFLGERYMGTLVSPTAVTVDQSLGFFGGRGYNGTGLSSTSGLFSVRAAETFTTSAQGTYLTFETTTIGSTTRQTRMTISSSGDVGIGTASPGTKLDVSGSIRSSSQLISTVATGTAPLSVSSTTLVTNLNADLLDGLSATSANTGSTIVARDASGNFSAGTITANLTGTATTATYLNSAFSSSVADNITTRVNSGFWETSTATTAEGWPETTNGWYHLLASTHSNTENYYSMQFAGKFDDSNALYYRATGGSGSTAWNTIWHSGNDTLLGRSNNIENTIVRRDASGQFVASSVVCIDAFKFSSNPGSRIQSTIGGYDFYDSNNGVVASINNTGPSQNQRYLSAHNIISDKFTVTDGSLSSYPGSGNTRLTIDATSAALNFTYTPGSSGDSWIFRRNLAGGTGDIRFINGTGETGVELIAGANSWTSTSDIRLKQDIEKLKESKNIILNLNPVQYKFKNNQDKLFAGFIAQEMVDFIPEAVKIGDNAEPTTENENNFNYWGITSDMIIPYLTKALQEAFEEIQKLKERIEILES